MKKQKHLNPGLLKLLAVFIIALSLIMIIKGGYQTGRWLHQVLHNK
jgi:uncharacterized membrane protein